MDIEDRGAQSAAALIADFASGFKMVTKNWHGNFPVIINDDWEWTSPQGYQLVGVYALSTTTPGENPLFYYGAQTAGGQAAMGLIAFAKRVEGGKLPLARLSADRAEAVGAKLGWSNCAVVADGTILVGLVSDDSGRFSSLKWKVVTPMRMPTTA